MKINQIIKEESENEEALYEPFNDSFSGMNLIHSSNSFTNGGMKLFKFRKQSTDTFIPMHNEINRLCLEKFGLPVRNLLFCYTYINNTNNRFSDHYKIIPIGDNYRLFYSPGIVDFTEKYNAFISDIIIDIIFKIENNLLKKYPDESEDIKNAINIIKHINENVYKTYNELKDKIIDIFKEHFSNNNLINEIAYIFDNKIEKLNKDCNHYVSSITEIKNKNDLANAGYSEIMVYAPDNFYALRE